MGHREYFILKTSNKNVESLLDEVKSTVKPPRGYTIDLHIGKYNVNVVSDIFGADLEIIRELDLAVSSKVVEICEKRGIECHLLEPLQII